MEGGSVQAVDTYTNLVRDHAGFQQLMETTGVEETGEGEEKPGVNDDKSGGGEKKKKRKGRALMQQEERGLASVPWSVYAAYIRASGSMLNVPVVLSALIISQAVNILTGLWLSWWTSDNFGFSNAQYIGVYAGLGALQVLCMFVFSVLLSVFATRASKRMLYDAVTTVLRAPMSFFDTTPLGRITNRFSRDVDSMDNVLAGKSSTHGLPQLSLVSRGWLPLP
ncbi:hypothetical protein IMZ48_24955 [Candidatus Bathyarchaeota archaeon]|nr:hypothetical protein [Candidatus Bathyarchaeota archaeon]